MGKSEFRPELIQEYGTVEEVRKVVAVYRKSHQLTDEQMASDEWVPIGKLADACEEAGITHDGPNSILVRSIGGDRALYEPWHPSLETYYGKGKRWFRKSSLTEGIQAILSRISVKQSVYFPSPPASSPPASSRAK
jgi:hypothetical protein